MWAILLQILKEACKYNLHVFVALVLILGAIGYCLHLFLMSQKDTTHKFDFIGMKLTGIEDKVDGLISDVADHTTKIIKLETISYKLEQKWENEANAG